MEAQRVALSPPQRGASIPKNKQVKEDHTLLLKKELAPPLIPLLAYVWGALHGPIE